MEREDIITWEAFISANPSAYKTVDYDFALSKVEEATHMAEKLGIQGAERVFKYRADAIGYRDQEIHIIEIKKRATPAVIGQVLADKNLYIRDENPQLPVKAVIIAREAAPDMDFLAASNGIFLIIV